MLQVLILAATVHNFIFFNLDRPQIRSEAFLGSTAEGAQLKYTWRELEPEQGRYDFTAIRTDLAFLQSRGKKLFIQLQDVSFYPTIVNTPAYIKAARQYDNGQPAGWVAPRWDPATSRRFHLLLQALGKEFDGRIEGITLAETSIDFGENGEFAPPGVTNEKYRDAILANMAALKRAFPRSVAMQYANFMPGEWLPGTNRHYLESVYQRARELGVAVGNPDLLPGRKGQMNHGYKLMHAWTSEAPVGVAVQEGNYQFAKVPELWKFANEYLRADYIFWFAEEPYYKRDVLPFLSGAAGFSPPASPLQRMLAGAKAQVGKTRGYDPSYRRLGYPGGDVPMETGVCSDVVIRAFRRAGLDLQVLVHEDMKRNFSAYPRNWGLRAPDTNIDHRRVPNLATFFRRKGRAVAGDLRTGDYQPGDIVTWRLSSGVPHIGIVSDIRRGERYLMIHNIGSGAQIEDVLFAYEVTGHFRWFL
jgi:uncharacterized protein YijF (DUF1287 family)